MKRKELEQEIKRLKISNEKEIGKLVENNVITEVIGEIYTFICQLFPEDNKKLEQFEAKIKEIYKSF